MRDERPKVVLATNSSWNIVNFRAGLVRALVKAGYEVVAVAPAEPEAAHRMAALGIRHIDVGIERSGLNPLSDLGLVLRYRALFKKLRPAALLSFTIKPNIYACLAARTLGIPAVANVSGLGTLFIKPGPVTKLATTMYRVALARACVVFLQNEDDRALFVRNRIIRARQARLIPGSGIDLDHFQPAAYPAGPVTFVLIGRLLGDKGIREYVAAARLIRSERQDARFQLLGGFDPHNRTSVGPRELDGWVAEGVIEYLGETEDVRPFIASASAVVLPSYREGLPRTLLEGAAMARPLIATDVPGCRSVVEDGVNGLLCRARNAQSLAETMSRFLKLDWSERRQMGSAGREMVKIRFCQDLVERAYLEAITSCESNASFCTEDPYG